VSAYEIDTTIGDSWRPISLLERELNPLPPPTIAGALYANTRHLLSGAPESGKSMVALSYSRDVLKQGGVVVYIDHENGPAAILERLRLFNIPDRAINRFRYIEPDEPVQHAELQIAELVEDASLVVIDSMIGSLSIHGYDPNSGADIEAWSRRVLTPLRASGAATCTLDHVTKDPNGRAYAIGSERKVGVHEVHLRVEAISPFSRNRAGSCRVTVLKDRPGHLNRPTLGTFTLNPDADPVHTWTLYDPAADHDAEGNFRPTTLMMRVSEYISMNAPESKRQLVSNVKGSTKGILLAIDALIREGYASEQEAVGRRGGGTEIHHVVLFEFDPEETVSNRFQETVNTTVSPVCKDRERETVVGQKPEPTVSPSQRSPNGSQPSLIELPRPCPICKATHSLDPYLANGGAYCCEPCAQGDACACKYLEAPAP
jgi:hypothetical protein